MTFEELWEQEEQQGLVQRMRQEYPDWRRRRNQRRAVTATVAVLVVAGVSLFNHQFSVPYGYDSVACNRSGIPEAHWAEMAGNILTIKTL